MGFSTNINARFSHLDLPQPLASTAETAKRLSEFFEQKQ